MTGDRVPRSRAGGRTPIRVPRPLAGPVLPRRRPGVGALWGLVVVVLCLIGILVGRLVQLQLVEHEVLAEEAAAVNTRVVTEPALRGRILAADGTPLVTNAASTVVTVDPEVLLESEDAGRALVESVADELDLPVESLWGRTLLCGTPDAPPVPACFSGSPYQPVPIAYDVDPVSALGVLERPGAFPGIEVTAVAVRDYPLAEVNAAHLLGYLGRPTAEEVDDEASVAAQDRVGRTGLEQAYDAQLRGTSGRTTVAVDPRGVVTGEVGHTDPVSGLDLVTYLDPEVQATVERVLAEGVATAREDGWPADSAAGVVLDVETGGVVAAASWPAYDPGIWTSGVTQAQYDELTDDSGGQPLVNRVIAGTYPPASTFKAVTLPAALRQGIDPEASYDCPGSVEIGGRTFTNFESAAHGALDLPGIIEVSCDTAFYTWAYDTWQDLGGLAQQSDLRDPYVLTAEDFRIGQPTGVDLAGESAGTLPSREWKRAYWEATREATCERAETGYPEEKDKDRREFLEQLAEENCVDGWQYRPGDAVNFSIGQGDIATTPLQIAVMYAAVANGGTLVEPRAAAEFRTRDGEVVEQVPTEEAGTLDVDPEALDILREGLEGVNVRGTGAEGFAGFDLAAYPVAGKTGSAESFGRKSTGWYASYGPTDDPRYAVVVVFEQGGIAGDVAVPAAREIWDVLAAKGE